MYRDIGAAAAALRGSGGDGPTCRLAGAAPAGEPVQRLDYVSVRSALAAIGVPFPLAAVATTEAEAVEAATHTGFPLVLKAMGLQHKSDAGGVVLDVRDLPALRSAYRDVAQRLAPAAVSVEAMADRSGGVELIVGAHQDPRCGPVVMVGLGGVFTEVLDDVAFALAPVSEATAERLLRSLRAAPLLLGARGRSPVDMTALAGLVARVSEFAAAHPELAAVEINPVLAGPDGVLALDARAVAPEADTEDGPDAGTSPGPPALMRRACSRSGLIATRGAVRIRGQARTGGRGPTAMKRGARLSLRASSASATSGPRKDSRIRAYDAVRLSS